MKKELNIADILKDSPNAKLFDRLRNRKVQLNYISDLGDEEVIWCNDYTNDKNKNYCFGYSEYGTKRGYLDGLQILKPSKEMQDWSKFAWKKGDVLVNSATKRKVYFDKWENDTYTRFIAKLENLVTWGYMCNTSDYTLASEEDSKACIAKTEKLFGGGKFNPETLNVEQPKQEFHEGDIVFVKGEEGYKDYIEIFSHFDDNGIYDYASYNIQYAKLDCSGKYEIPEYEYQDIRPATDSEKQQLFSALEKENKRWNPDTKQIEDLPKKCELKPMDWCLMRDHGEKWKICQFGFFDKMDAFEAQYNAVGGNWYNECIPYNDSTKHLLGTTKEWKGGNNG